MSQLETTTKEWVHGRAATLKDEIAAIPDDSHRPYALHDAVVKLRMWAGDVSLLLDRQGRAKPAERVRELVADAELTTKKDIQRVHRAVLRALGKDG